MGKKTIGLTTGDIKYLLRHGELEAGRFYGSDLSVVYYGKLKQHKVVKKKVRRKKRAPRSMGFFGAMGSW